MGSLGLDQLTDDQLLELTVEVCNELVARDPYVRNLAQHTIRTKAERLEVQREALKVAVRAATVAYMDVIAAEALEEVREGVRKGTIRLLTSAQEARAAVDATLEAKIKVVDETVAAIQQGKHRAVQPTPAYDPGGDLADWEQESGIAIAHRQRQQDMANAMGQLQASAVAGSIGSTINAKKPQRFTLGPIGPPILPPKQPGKKRW